MLWLYFFWLVILGDCILSDVPKQERNEELILNYEQNMQDAIAIMHKLQTGIDVNVHFTGTGIQNIFKVIKETKAWC